ncbi:MAG: hypothetical protein ABS942_07700 [Solibacillus sp.]|uniref:hypothetical protein n=1 Tax=unclassified Solibacillus TaxID=2637870 RepID=UPI0031019648
MRFLKCLMGLCSVIILSGCIAEEYDYSPPSIILGSTGIQMVESNIDWTRVDEYLKQTEDILTLAKQQPQFRVQASKEDYIQFDSQDFAIKELTVSVWQGENQLPLEMKNERTFNFPSQVGEYVVEVNLVSDNGSAQYVANILIE